MVETTETTEAAALLDGSGGRRWRVRPPSDVSAFDGAEWPPLISLLLSQRGVHSLAEAEAHFADPLELTDPALMPDLDLAVERLGRACREGETVAILGDFDVDGITATTVLVEGLQALGARPLPYIPHRFTEGYGPNVDAVRQLHRDGGLRHVVGAGDRRGE